MTTVGGSKICSATNSYNTADFVNLEFSVKDDTITITYKDDNIKEVDIILNLILMVQAIRMLVNVHLVVIINLLVMVVLVILLRINGIRLMRMELRLLIMIMKLRMVILPLE